VQDFEHGLTRITLAPYILKATALFGVHENSINPNMYQELSDLIENRETRLEKQVI
jgi:hypothetical protein